ncbi:MAG: hypothetical protein LUC93_02890 [Planctomycetaceae bacterium]|nr:hypothetical protein [Planctomycetaceae bacterium]
MMRWLLLCCFAACASCVQARDFCEGMPESCREDLVRIEDAFSTGLSGASDVTERYEVHRLRVVALAELVERTYGSTLTWLAEREDEEAATLQSEQGRWLRELHEALSGADTVEGMAAVGEMLLARLHDFGNATRGGTCTGTECR